MRESKGRAVVVGGSIAGLCSAHALLSAGWQVVVLEKTTASPTGSPTGAGLGLDPLSRTIINSWLPQQRSEDLLNNHTLPLTIDQNQVTDSEDKISRMLTRDESFNFRAAYWSDLHGLLYKGLPPDIFLWGHMFLSFYVSNNNKSVVVQSEVLQTRNVVEIVGDLLVAADGCLSSIRHTFLPGLLSTNMSILDAAVLGQCLMKSGVENLSAGLNEYEFIQVPVTSKQVLHSRRLGQMKQGLVLADGEVFDPKTCNPEECGDLQQKYMPGFDEMPSVFSTIVTSKY